MHLARFRLEAEEKACQAELELRLQVKRLEIEANTAVRLHQLEFTSQKPLRQFPPLPLVHKTINSTLVNM